MTHLTEKDIPGLYSLESAAHTAGLSTELLASAIGNGDLPGVLLLHLGPRRLRFVRARPFIAWLNGDSVISLTPTQGGK